MIAHEPQETGALVCDFGRGSREQSQGIRGKDHVRAVPKPLELVTPHG
jgi:hypothetical protein